MRATVDRTTYLTYGIEDDNLPVLLSSVIFSAFQKTARTRCFLSKTRKIL
jgi:hypothetical protein